MGSAQTDGINRLSSAQRDCLRLVAENRSSKEIARLLLVSPHTVDQRLKRATSILAVSTRFEAARLFANHERDVDRPTTIYEGLVYQSPELSAVGKMAEMGRPPRELDLRGGGERGSTLHEAQASYFSMFESHVAPRTFLSILTEARLENDLSGTWRLIAMLAIMFGGITAFAVLVNVAEGLSRIY